MGFEFLIVNNEDSAWRIVPGQERFAKPVECSSDFAYGIIDYLKGMGVTDVQVEMDRHQIKAVTVSRADYESCLLKRVREASERSISFDKMEDSSGVPRVSVVEWESDSENRDSGDELIFPME